MDDLLLECDTSSRMLERKSRKASYNQKKALGSGKTAYKDGNDVGYKDAKQKYSMYGKEIRTYATFQSLNNRFRNILEQEKNMSGMLGLGKKLVKGIKGLGSTAKGKKIMADIMATDEIVKQRYDILESMQDSFKLDDTEYDSDEEFDSLIESELAYEPPKETDIGTKISKAMGDSEQP